MRLTPEPTTIRFPSTLSAPAIPFAAGLLGALTDGRITIAATDASDKTNPFLPPLMPDALPLWTRPVPTSDTTFLISDGRGAQFAAA